MPTPSVRVIIPCFNHGRFVADAVRSAVAQAQTSSARIEIVIVNDGSTDADTAAACDACRDLATPETPVHILHQANTGLPGARNRGVAHDTSGGGNPPPDFILPLDADDYLEPTAIHDLLSAIDAERFTGRDQDISHAYGQQRMVDLGSGIWQVPDWDPLLLAVTNIHPPTALIRRDRFNEVGGYTESMRLGYEDWDLWLKFASRGLRGVRIRKPIYTWRRHSPDTMITQAIARHDEIYSGIVSRHREFFDRHARELLLLSNQLLRRADANWLDENRDSIALRNLRSLCADWKSAAESAWSTASAVKAQTDSAEQALKSEIMRLTAAAADLRAHYESKPSVRASRALHRAIDALPTILANPIRAVLRALPRGNH